MKTQEQKNSFSKMKSDAVAFIQKWFAQNPTTVIVNSFNDDYEDDELAEQYMLDEIDTLMVLDDFTFNYGWNTDNGEGANVVGLTSNGFMLASVESCDSYIEEYGNADTEKLLEMKETIENIGMARLVVNI